MSLEDGKSEDEGASGAPNNPFSYNPTQSSMGTRTRNNSPVGNSGPDILGAETLAPTGSQMGASVVSDLSGICSKLELDL